MFDNFVLFLKKIFLSLSFKLSFYSGLILFLSLLAFTYHSIMVQRQGVTDKMVQAAIKDSDVIKAAIWNGMMTKDREVIRQIVLAIGEEGGFDRIKIYDSQGSLRYSSRKDAALGAPDEDSLNLLGDLGSDPTIRHRFAPDGGLLYVVNPLRNTESCSSAACHAHPASQRVLGALIVKVSLATTNDEILRNARGTVFFALFLFLLISTIIGLAMVFLVTPHLRRLRESAQKVARGEFDPLAENRGFDEIAELERSFDEMQRQVHERTTRLAAGRKLYKSLFDEVPCYLTVVTQEYRIARTNNAFRDRFGDRVGRRCYTGYKGLVDKCPDCPVERTFSDGASHESEECWTIDGRNVHVIVKTAPVYDNEGNIPEVLEMSLDVTRLKQLQAAVEKGREEYKHLFENVPCYLTVVDRDFNIVRENDAFVRDFGQHIGGKCYRVYKKRDEKCAQCPVLKTFEDGQSHHSEEVWDRHGQPMNIVVNTSPLTDETGQVTAVMEMCTDITEIRQLRDDLAVLGETIAGMSHTIKNILAGLKGGVYVVDSGLDRGKEDRVRQGWVMVKKNVEKISELVAGILYASKERQPEYKECDPGELLTDVCDLYQSKAQSEGIDLVRDFSREMPLCLLDPAGMHSAVSNLVSNAVEACRTLKGEHHQITVSGRVEGDLLIVRVADDGRGMPQDVREKLFNKFFSTKGSKGTGLGLVLTKKVVSEHGGQIRVQSKRGKGTTFTLEIPFKPVPVHQPLETAVG